MTARVRPAFFALGLLLYIASFFLPAIVDSGTFRPGYYCAVLLVLAVPAIGNLFRFQSSALESILESASMLAENHRVQKGRN